MIKITRIDLNVLEMKTRMPFKYGIATMTEVPHLFVRAELDAGGARAAGIAADGLPPKWFTKNPTTPFSEDLVEMRACIRNACALANGAPPVRTVFELWEHVYKEQARWGAAKKFPPLLWNFGVSLIERAIIDAFCRAQKVTFSRALRENLLGIELGRVRPELAGLTPRELLPEAPLRSIHIRHTVGLADPLKPADIIPAEKVDDGLPQSLDQNIEVYGLTHFKIKLCGDAQKDVARLTQLVEILERLSPKYVYSLDGNEQYKSVDAFRVFWESLQANAAFKSFLSRCLFVEQPLHRDVALSGETATGMLKWSNRPPTIIDESDGELASLPRALDAGYNGTSHKNCKGIFKGIANACLLEARRRREPNAKFILSGEDLGSVGPVSMPQDAGVAATLGVDHVERNGHHYFAGLSMFPKAIQASVLEKHPDLYRSHNGFPTLAITGGRVNIGSVIDAPFGVATEFDSRQFPAMQD